MTRRQGLITIGAAVISGLLLYLSGLILYPASPFVIITFLGVFPLLAPIFAGAFHGAGWLLGVTFFVKEMTVFTLLRRICWKLRNLCWNFTRLCWGGAKNMITSLLTPTPAEEEPDSSVRRPEMPVPAPAKPKTINNRVRGLLTRGRRD